MKEFWNAEYSLDMIYEIKKIGEFLQKAKSPSQFDKAIPVLRKCKRCYEHLDFTGAYDKLQAIIKEYENDILSTEYNTVSMVIAVHDRKIGKGVI